MNTDNNSKLKMEITQDKLIDFLMHAATREDIAQLDNKVDQKLDKLDKKIDKLDQRIDALDFKIDNRTDGLRTEFNKRFDQLDAKYDKLIWFIMASILGPIILHFIK